MREDNIDGDSTKALWEEERVRKLLDSASKEVAKINTDNVVKELRKWRKER